MKIPENLKIVRTKSKGRGLISKNKIKKDKVVLKLDSGITIRPNSTASKTAIQIDEDSFLDSNPRQIRDLLNHSCNPTVRIDFTKMACIAIKDISKEDEITFNYSSTEYDLKSKDEDFECFCGSKNCLGRVKGFKYLTIEERREIESLLTPFLLRKIK